MNLFLLVPMLGKSYYLKREISMHDVFKQMHICLVSEAMHL